jgi:hypothetical protein
MGVVKIIGCHPNSGRYLAKPGIRGDAWNKCAMIRAFFVD